MQEPLPRSSAWVSHGVPHHLIYWDRVSLPLLSKTAKKVMHVPLYSFGGRFGEAETHHKDQNFQGRAKSMLRNMCHQQNVAEVGDQIQSKTSGMKNGWVRSNDGAIKDHQK